MSQGSVRLAFDEVGLLGRLPTARSITLACPALEPPPDLSPEGRRLALQAWEDRTRAEYAGVMIVRHFHGLLVDLNSPMDLQELALAMVLQEQQHARLCMNAVKSLGGAAELTFELDQLQIQRSDAPLEVQFFQTLVGTYAIGEAVALDLLVGSLEALPESGYREILKLIARDEVLHGRLGLQVLQQVKSGEPAPWIPWPGADAIAAMARGQIDYMKQRDLVEPDEARAFDDPQLAVELQGLGIPDSRHFRRIYDESLEEKLPTAFAKLGVTV
ncbi:MAG: hypothetical protein CMH55_02265 [Myxococcales bacterium]|nr:hypothetical protein [Myxococcales bacterium]